MKTGDMVEKFRLVAKLGNGGFGEVWKAEHTELPGKYEVFKFPAGEEAVEVLREQAGMLQSLNHPGIVKITDLDTSGVNPYIRMEYVEGMTLEDKLQLEGKISWQEALALCSQILVPLEEAHRKKIIHGNLKPSNIFLVQDGVKIADFGLAPGGIMNPKEPFGRPAENAYAMNRWAYLAPEQKEGKLRQASDIYALGVILYRAITGTVPVGLEPPSQLVENCPPYVDKLVAKMLAHIPARLQNLSQLRTLLAKAPREEGSFGFSNFLFILGICLIIFALGFTIRIPYALIMLVSLGLILIECARPNIPKFWPVLLFWLGTGLSCIWVVERLYRFIYVPTSLAILGAVWFLAVADEKKEEKK